MVCILRVFCFPYGFPLRCDCILPSLPGHSKRLCQLWPDIGYYEFNADRIHMEANIPSHASGAYRAMKYQELIQEFLYTHIVLCFSILLKGILYLLRHIRFIHTSRDEQLSYFDGIQG